MLLFVFWYIFNDQCFSFFINIFKSRAVYGKVFIFNHITYDMCCSFLIKYKIQQHREGMLIIMMISNTLKIFCLILTEGNYVVENDKHIYITLLCELIY